MKTLIYALALIVVSFAAGFILAQNDPAPAVKEIIVTKTVDRIVYRDYAKVDCCELLNKYDTSPMIIKYNVNEMKPEYTAVDLSWALYERNGLQEIRVPVHESGNWKLYTGLAIGAMAAGGIACLLK